MMTGMILDPLPTGVTNPTTVDFHHTGERDDDEPVSAAVSLVDGSWVVDTLNVPPGRWYGTVHATRAGSGFTYPVNYVDLPEDPTLLVSPESVAVADGFALPLTETQREIITEAIRAAQDDVSAHLGRPLTPVTYVQTGCYDYGVGWNLTLHGDDVNVQVVSVEPEYIDSQPTGYFTVTYTAGIDAHEAQYGPIRRFVKAHAQYSPDVVREWRKTSEAKQTQTKKAASTEGQSITYTDPSLGVSSGKAGTGAPGDLPTLGSLDRWRLAGRAVHVARSRVDAPIYPGGQWPY